MQADTREAEAPEDMRSAFGTLPAITLPVWFLTGLYLPSAVIPVPHCPGLREPRSLRNLRSGGTPKPTASLSGHGPGGPPSRVAQVCCRKTDRRTGRQTLGPNCCSPIAPPCDNEVTNLRLPKAQSPHGGPHEASGRSGVSPRNLAGYSADSRSTLGRNWRADISTWGGATEPYSKSFPRGVSRSPSDGQQGPGRGLWDHHSSHVFYVGGDR